MLGSPIRIESSIIYVLQVNLIRVFTIGAQFETENIGLTNLTFLLFAATSWLLVVVVIGSLVGSIRQEEVGHKRGKD